MSWVMVDVEADGPVPGVDMYSMVALGAVIVEPGLHRRFRGLFKPISSKWDAKALGISGYSREDTLGFPDPELTMKAFESWLEKNSKDRLLFVSDNNGFDWQFVNYYCHRFIGSNPFGHSSTNLGSLYKGLMKSTYSNFKSLRKTAHTHNPVDDAVGNAEAMLTMRNLGLSF